VVAFFYGKKGILIAGMRHIENDGRHIRIGEYASDDCPIVIAGQRMVD